MYFVKMHLLQR